MKSLSIKAWDIGGFKDATNFEDSNPVMKYLNLGKISYGNFGVKRTPEDLSHENWKANMKKSELTCPKLHYLHLSQQHWQPSD